MVDVIDKAQALQEQHITTAIAAAKKQIQHLKKGRCNYCEEPTENYFCDDDCKADYEYEQRIRAKQRGEHSR